MTCTRGGSNLREDPALLRGVLAGEDHSPVYPDNECLLCLREGRDDDKCWHRHWETTDAGTGNTERRAGAGVR